MEDGEESGTLEREDDPDSMIVDKGILVRKTGTTSDVWPHVDEVPVIEELVEAELTLWDNEPTQKRTVQLANGDEEIANPLQWWRLNQTRFPRLACLAERYLAIQATSAPSERLFSAAGLTIAKDRARLLPNNAAMLIFLHDNLPIARAWRARRGLPEIA